MLSFIDELKAICQKKVGLTIIQETKYTRITILLLYILWKEYKGPLVIQIINDLGGDRAGEDYRIKKSVWTWTHSIYKSYTSTLPIVLKSQYCRLVSKHWRLCFSLCLYTTSNSILQIRFIHLSQLAIFQI